MNVEAQKHSQDQSYGFPIVPQTSAQEKAEASMEMEGAGGLGLLLTLVVGIGTVAIVGAIYQLVLTQIGQDPTVQAGFDGENQTNATLAIGYGQTALNTGLAKLGLIMLVYSFAIVLAAVMIYKRFG